jgi:uncharacterized protein YjbI with pentapeptide repeats
METALNIATIVFLATLFFGVLLLGYGIWGWLVWRRYHLPAPKLERLPTHAVDEARKGLERLRTQYFRASGEKRSRLGLEVQRLEMRIHHLQLRTNEDQFTYYQLCKRREKSWREWKKTFDHIGTLNRRERSRTRAALADTTMRYRELDKLVHDEWHRATALDDLNLQELRTQGVLPPETAAAPAPSAGQRGEEADSASYSAPEQAEPEEAEETEEAESTVALDPNQLSGGAKAVTAVPAPLPDDTTSPPFATGATGTMHQADFALADLPKAGLRYADPEFNMAGIPGGMLADANLSGASFAGVRLTGTQIFRGCNLSGIDLRGVSMARAEQPHQFVDCDLTGASFGQAGIEYVLFLRCDLSYSQWQNAQLNRVKFSECRISGSNWAGVDLSRTIMTVDMQGQVDFGQAAQPPHVSAPSPYAQGGRGGPAHSTATAAPASPAAPGAGTPAKGGDPAQPLPEDQ